MRTLPIASLLLAVAAAPHLAACIGRSCTDEAVPSVEVTVVSLVDGEEVVQKDAKVTFSVDGGGEAPALCATSVTSGGGCDLWHAGFERSGSFLVKAMSADGTMLAETTVDVDAEECHVNTQAVKLTLK